VAGDGIQWLVAVGGGNVRVCQLGTPPQNSLGLGCWRLVYLGWPERNLGKNLKSLEI
jgi:hypothetical protein